jgi:hypothetical protein
MGSPKRRKQVTQDLNPSPVGSNWCKEMGENPGREQLHVTKKKHLISSLKILQVCYTLVCGIPAHKKASPKV